MDIRYYYTIAYPMLHTLSCIFWVIGLSKLLYVHSVHCTVHSSFDSPMVDTFTNHVGLWEKFVGRKTSQKNIHTSTEKKYRIIYVYLLRYRVSQRLFDIRRNLKQCMELAWHPPALISLLAH